MLEGPEAVIALWRSWTEVTDAEFRFETLSGDDKHLALRVEGSGLAAAFAGGGAMEYGVALVATILDDRISRNEWFESDGAALARLEELRRAERRPPREVVD